MYANPLIQRYRYSLLRPTQLWIYLTIYIAVTILILFVNLTNYRYQIDPGPLSEFMQSMYYQFLILQTVILWVFATFGAGTAVTTEIAQKSWDFFRLLPMTACSKLVGIIVGKNLVVLLLAIVNCIFLLVFGIVGQVNSALQIQIAFVLGATTLLLTSGALLLSLLNTEKKRTSNNVGFLIFLMFVFGYAIPLFAMAFDNEKSPDEILVPFYTIKIPILVLVGAVALYFSGWALKGIVRKFTHEREPLFSRFGGVLFLIGFAAVGLGLFSPYFEEGPSSVFGFWVLCLTPAIIVLIGSLRMFDRYMEHTRLLRSQTQSGVPGMLSILTYSNLFLGLGLFIVWLGFALGAARWAALDSGPVLYTALVLLTFYMFPVLLLELLALYKTAQSKIHLLVGFIFVLQLILPPVFSSVTENESLNLLSPIGFFQEMILIRNLDEIGPYTGVLLVNIILCIIPAVLIWRRYSTILGARSRM